jgi:hypothetical protein
MKNWAFICPPFAAAVVAAGFWWSKQVSGPASPPLDVSLFQFVNSAGNILALLFLGTGLLMILKDRKVRDGRRTGFYVVWYVLAIALLAFIEGVVVINLG